MTFAPDSPVVSEVRASPSHDARGGDIDMLLLHYTGMKTAEAACARLCDPASKVSCHYVVLEDGRVLQLAPEARRAWHAGVSSWEGETGTNSRSIGVEIVNRGHDFDYPAFPDPQIGAVIALSRDICARNGIQSERVLGHSDVAPQRKQDPGEKFPWARLASEGVGHWTSPVAIEEGTTLGPGDEGEPVEELQTLLNLYGYGLEIDGVYAPATIAVVKAFQRHFRPERIDGVADFSTSRTLRNLLSGLKGR